MAIHQTKQSYSDILKDAGNISGVAMRLRSVSYMHTTRYPAFMEVGGASNLNVINKKMKDFLRRLDSNLKTIVVSQRMTEETKLNALFAQYVLQSDDPEAQNACQGTFEAKLDYLNRILKVPDFNKDFYAPISQLISSVADDMYDEVLSEIAKPDTQMKKLDSDQLNTLLSILNAWYVEMERIAASYMSQNTAEIVEEIFYTPMRKLQGLITFVKSRAAGKSRVSSYKQDIINAVVGTKAWDRSDATVKQAFASVKGSVAGLERFKSGEWEEEQLANVESLFGNIDVRNGVVFEGSRATKNYGNRNSPQKIDVVWTLITDDAVQNINLSVSSKFDGNLQIHNGGSITSYIRNLQNNPSTGDIGDLFQSPEFLYYFVNEMFMRNVQFSTDNDFYDNFINILAAAAYIFIGVDVIDTTTTPWTFGDGVDFLYTGNRLVPVSEILNNIIIHLKDVRVTINRQNPSDIISRKWGKIRNAGPGFYNPIVTAAGVEASKSYMQRISHRVSLSANLFR